METFFYRSSIRQTVHVVFLMKYQIIKNLQSRYNKKRVSRKQSKEKKKSDDTTKMLNNSVKPSNEFKYGSPKKSLSKNQIATVQEVRTNKKAATL